MKTKPFLPPGFEPHPIFLSIAPTEFQVMIKCLYADTSRAEEEGEFGEEEEEEEEEAYIISKLPLK